MVTVTKLRPTVRRTGGPDKDAVIERAIPDFRGFLRQLPKVEVLDAWQRGDQQGLKETFDGTRQAIGMPWSPADQTEPEYEDLASRSANPFGKLVVNAVVQTVYVDNVRMTPEDEAPDPDAPTLESWDVLLENDWASRQISLVRSAVAHGIAYVRALPGKSPITGEQSATVRPVSAKRMAAFFDDFDDEWPTSAIECVKQPQNEFGEYIWAIDWYDDKYVHHLQVKGDSEDKKDWTYISNDPHDLGVVPIVPWSNQLDLDGNAIGEIEPIIPLLRRIDQDTFDRLIVQRFGAWKIRYIAGLMRPEGGPAAERAKKLQMRVEDILIAPDVDTKFGTLDHTDTDGYIKATDADLRLLAAVTQTPPHHLLGLSSNLQAEALAAAEAGLQRKSQEFKIFNASSQVRLIRLVAKIIGNREEATAKTIEIRYRDTESRSFVQAAQALSQLATGLGIPAEMLWDRIPNWTDEDTERAKRLVEQGVVDDMLAAIAAGAQQQPAGDATDAANAQGKDGSTLNSQQSAAKAQANAVAPS